MEDYVFGAASWQTREQGEENCYLLTNGLGGFSSLTMVGTNVRNDHALLISCDNARNQRYHLVTNISEHVAGELLSFVNLDSFELGAYPKWRYSIGAAQIVKSIAMPDRRNAVVVQYEITNRSLEACEFNATPFFQLIEKGIEYTGSPAIEMDVEPGGGRVTNGSLTIHFVTNGQTKKLPQTQNWPLEFPYDKRDGRDATGLAVANHTLTWQVPPGSSAVATIIYDVEPIIFSPSSVFINAETIASTVVETAGFEDPIARRLVFAANQFIVDKLSLSPDSKTIIAGYPFFLDWGRDTMIALGGCCIATKQFETTKSILRSFMQYLRRGLMPNMFPEGENEPFYNTVDASLLFINTVWEYYKASNDRAFIAEAQATILEIIEWYQRGTDFGIKMDDDGLISAGSGFDQVTWMDVRVGDIVPTPRHGKPVEINASWYSALVVATKVASELGIDEPTSLIGQPLSDLARQVRASFNAKFWNAERGCLRDVISNPPNPNTDDQIRCNQIWAVSYPFTMLDAEQQRQVVDRVFENLYTPVGLRSLEKSDPEFHPHYGGSTLERDLAYHQGTVWGFPLGGYYLAYLRAERNSSEAIGTVRHQLRGIEAALREGCVGQLAEIYDGARPTVSRGCFAQAWSVGEILKVYAELDRLTNTGSEGTTADIGPEAKVIGSVPEVPSTT